MAVAMVFRCADARLTATVTASRAAPTKLDPAPQCVPTISIPRARVKRRSGLAPLHVVRDGDREILTAHFFVTRPHDLRTMQKLAENYSPDLTTSY
jgi:hypothetical protein